VQLYREMRSDLVQQIVRRLGKVQPVSAEDE
jgi:outer membrane lipopolysaccharide assembly protein LptE/RlpB